MEAARGLRLGRYVLLRRLGAGGMAEVWEASDDLLRRNVAVKIIRAALSESEEFASRFLREAQVSARLQHPHVVPVFDVGGESGALFVVMPVLPGGTLADRLSSGISDATALEWLGALASALDFAHAKGVVHRDVKPQNVLFDEVGQPLLSDFGLAKSFDETAQLTQTGAALGTPAYMSPEQAMGTSAGPAADQYSLGILAFRLLAGRLPLEKAPTPVLLQRTCFEPMPPPSTFRPGLPPAVDGVFDRVLGKRPAERYATCTAFVQALSAAMGHGAAAIAPAPSEAETVFSAERATPPPPLPSLSRRPTPSRPSGAQPAPQSTPRSTPPPIVRLPLQTPPSTPSLGSSAGTGASVPAGAVARLRALPLPVLLVGTAFLATLSFSLVLSFCDPGSVDSLKHVFLMPTPLPAVPSTPTAPPAAPAPPTPAPPTPVPVPTPEPTLAPIVLPTPEPMPTREPAPAPPPRPIARLRPTAAPWAAYRPSPTPFPTWTPWPTPVPLPTQPPAVAAAPGASSASRPPTAPQKSAADPFAAVPHLSYPAEMRVKDAWVEVKRGGELELYFKFTEKLRGPDEGTGVFGSLTIPTRGSAPLVPGKNPILLQCDHLDSKKVHCLVPSPNGGTTLAEKLNDKDKVSARANLAGFLFTVTMRVED